VATLTPKEIEDRMATMTGWSLIDGKAIEKRYTFGSFREAISYIVRIAFHAEEADHHPDISIVHKSVTPRYWTHSEGGLTDKDFEGARKADRVSWV